MTNVKYCLATPILEAELEFINNDNTSEKVVVREGEILKDLVYYNGSENKTVTGVLKVINFSSKAVTTGRDYCIHDDESVVAKYISVNSLVVDCSDQFESNVISIPVKMLRGIGSTEKAPLASIGNVKYNTVAEAVVAAEAGSTIKLAADVKDDGLKIDKDLVIDLNGHTFTLLGGVGSGEVTSNGLQLLQGTNVTIKNGTLMIPTEAKDKFYILLQNYTNLTLEDVVLDGKNLDKYAFTDQDSYVLSNNSGTVNIIGNTTIIANNDGEKAYAFDVCKFANYDPPVVNVNTIGTIYGKIEVAEGLDNNLTITGGTFTVDVSKWVPETHTVTVNEDGTFTVAEKVAE